MQKSRKLKETLQKAQFTGNLDIGWAFVNQDRDNPVLDFISDNLIPEHLDLKLL